MNMAREGAPTNNLSRFVGFIRSFGGTCYFRGAGPAPKDWTAQSTAP